MAVGGLALGNESVVDDVVDVAPEYAMRIDEKDRIVISAADAPDTSVLCRTGNAADRMREMLPEFWDKSTDSAVGTLIETMGAQIDEQNALIEELAHRCSTSS